KPFATLPQQSGKPVAVEQSANYQVEPPKSTPAKKPKVKGMPARQKIARTMRWLPSYAWQRVVRRAPTRHVHLMIMIADHFEPAVIPEQGSARASYDVQEHRVESWIEEYPRIFDKCYDDEGRPLVHTYFYPAEQYEKGLLQPLAEFCRNGWGEIETHLHHGTAIPDTADNTRRLLLEFRDALAQEHGSLCYLDGKGEPCYGFVHGNFALANSAGGLNCGVDSEMQILA